MKLFSLFFVLVYTTTAFALETRETLEKVKSSTEKSLNAATTALEICKDPSRWEDCRKNLSQIKESDAVALTAVDTALEELKSSEDEFNTKAKAALIKTKEVLYQYRTGDSIADHNLRFTFRENEEGKLYITVYGGRFYAHSPITYITWANQELKFNLASSGLYTAKVRVGYNGEGWNTTYLLKIKPETNTLYIVDQEEQLPAQDFVVDGLK
jgi:hypothetical protein